VKCKAYNEGGRRLLPSCTQTQSMARSNNKLSLGLVWVIRWDRSSSADLKSTQKPLGSWLYFSRSWRQQLIASRTATRCSMGSPSQRAIPSICSTHPMIRSLGARRSNELSRNLSIFFNETAMSRRTQWCLDTCRLVDMCISQLSISHECHSE